MVLCMLFHSYQMHADVLYNQLSVDNRQFITQLGKEARRTITMRMVASTI